MGEWEDALAKYNEADKKFEETKDDRTKWRYATSAVISLGELISESFQEF